MYGGVRIWKASFAKLILDLSIGGHLAHGGSSRAVVGCGIEERCR
jgi:hypothetical protein